MNDQEPTNKEIMGAVGEVMEAIGHFSNTVDQRLDELKTTMVTKHYLDDKLFDLKGDLTMLISKEDYKVGELVTVLQEKKVLDDADVRRIRSMEPFPQK